MASSTAGGVSDADSQLKSGSESSLINLRLDDAAAKLQSSTGLQGHTAIHDATAAGGSQYPTRKITVLQSEALYQYILDTSVYPRENPYQKELREITEKLPRSVMAVPPDECQFLMLLLKLMNAKNVLELGVFTGSSLLCEALALPHDGKIVAIDIDRASYEVGAAVIEKAGLSHKVDFREGLILPQLDEMLLEEKNHGFFDFVLVDADKSNYLMYHERAMKLVKVGGVIGYDNTLWGGFLVAQENAQYWNWALKNRSYLLEVNQVLAADEHIEISQVPVGDGITLCRRIK